MFGLTAKATTEANTILTLIHAAAATLVMPPLSITNMTMGMSNLTTNTTINIITVHFTARWMVKFNNKKTPQAPFKIFKHLPHIC